VLAAHAIIDIVPVCICIFLPQFRFDSFERGSFCLSSFGGGRSRTPKLFLPCQFYCIPFPSEGEKKNILSFFLVSSTAFHFQVRERKKILSLEMWQLGIGICDNGDEENE